MSKVVPSEKCKRYEDAFMNVGPETGEEATKGSRASNEDKSLNPVEATGTSATPGPTKVASPGDPNRQTEPTRKPNRSVTEPNRRANQTEERKNSRNDSRNSSRKLRRQDSSVSTNSDASRLSKAQANKLLKVGDNGMLEQLGQEIATARAKVLSSGERFLQSTPFTVVVSVVIFSNAILEGVETHMSNGSDAGIQDSTWRWIGRAFLAFYTLEIVSRLLVYGIRQLIGDPWFLFDATIVISGLFELIFEIFFESGGGANVSQFRVLRLLRILKLMRVFRVLRFCHELFILVNSLAAALSTTVWTWILLMLITYVFAITFTKTLGHGYPDNDELQDKWGTIFRSAFTLFGMTTLEWIETARLYFDDEPLMIVLTVVFVVVTAFAVLNVTVAVIVNHTIEKGMANSEKKHEQLEEDIKNASAQIIHVFLDVDLDGDGVMTKDEFQKAVADPKIIRALKELELDNFDMSYLYDQLDLNRNGSISLHEFVQGILQLRGPAKAKRLLELHCDLLRENMSLQHDLQEMKKTQRDQEQVLNLIASRQDSLSKSLDTSLGQMTKALNSLVEELRDNKKNRVCPKRGSAA